MLIPKDIDLEIYQGATFNRAWEIVEEGTTSPMDLSGYTARMQIRAKIKDTDPLLELTTENGGITIDATPEKTTITLYIPPDETEALTVSKGVYDLELVDLALDVYRLMQGEITIHKEVTR